MIVSYDFDECLCGGPDWVESHFWRDLGLGEQVHICTARYETEAMAVDEWLESRGLLGSIPVTYTGRELKGPYLVELGANLHYDDNVQQCISALEHGIEVVHVD